MKDINIQTLKDKASLKKSKNMVCTYEINKNA